MAQPARRPTAPDDAPALDPSAVELAYRRQRAMRRARVERTRETRRAQMRFWVVLLLLLALTVFLALTIWHEIQRLFGL